jgi:signal transduction histidine kinase
VRELDRDLDLRFPRNGRDFILCVQDDGVGFDGSSQRTLSLVLGSGRTQGQWTG